MIKEMMQAIHMNARDKGFYDETQSKNLSDKLMLIVSEISEAQEADRKDHRTVTSVQAVMGWKSDSDFIPHFEKEVKNTFEDELADAVIRILDLAEWKGIDLETHIFAKMRYNTTRPKYHGKKY